MRTLKGIALVLVSYGLCLAAAFAGTLVTMGITEGWGAGRTGDAMVTLLACLGAFFALNALGVFLGLTWMRVPLGWRLLGAGLYAALLAGTFAVGAFLCAVLFNR